MHVIHSFPMNNQVALLKDFMIIHGIQGPLRTNWLKRWVIIQWDGCKGQ